MSQKDKPKWASGPLRINDATCHACFDGDGDLVGMVAVKDSGCIQLEVRGRVVNHECDSLRAAKAAVEAAYRKSVERSR